MKLLILFISIISLNAQEIFHSVVGGTNYTILKSQYSPSGDTHYTVLPQGAPVQIVPVQQPIQPIYQPVYQQYQQQYLQPQMYQQVNQNSALISQNAQAVTSIQSKLNKPVKRKRSFRRRMTTKGKINNGLLTIGVANEVLNKNNKYTNSKKARYGIGAAYLLNNIIR